MTGLFEKQEQEDLIQELVLFYLEFLKKRRGKISDNILFMAFKSKAMHIERTRLRERQSGLFDKKSLDDLSESIGFEPVSCFSLQDLENTIAIKEVRNLLSDKQNKFLDLICEGRTAEEARAELHISHTVFHDIHERILRGRKKNIKK